MPTIRYTTGWASATDAAAEGEMRRVSAAEAQSAVAEGYAELVRDAPPVIPEASAARPGLEQAAVSRRRTRGGRGSG